MTYEEIVTRAREEFSKGNASDIKGHLAVQFNITGEGHGAFYLEVSEGAVDVQPYEYYDRDAIVTTDAQTLLDISTGKTDMVQAFLSGALQVEGNLDKAQEVGKLIAAPKAAEAKETVAPATTETKETAAPVAATEKETKEKKTETAAAAPKAAARKTTTAAKKTTTAKKETGATVSRKKPRGAKRAAKKTR